MPSIDIEYVKSLVEDLSFYKNFVETGTYLGDTIFAMEKHFDRLYTIEVKPEIYESTRNKYRGDKIIFLLGDSITMLKVAIEKLEGPTIFFLDGHFSSGFTGKGQKDCPLLEELKDIFEGFGEEALIIIDDYRLFGKGPNVGGCTEDWEDVTLEAVKQIVDSRVARLFTTPSSIAEEDRLIIHLNKK